MIVIYTGDIQSTSKTTQQGKLYSNQINKSLIPG